METLLCVMVVTTLLLFMRFFFFEVITTTQNAQYDDMAILPRGLANIRIIESKVNCVFIIK